MVAKIETGKSLRGALLYNENKVAKGQAAFLSASGYVKDHDRLSFEDKLFRLSDLAERNQRAKTNTVHISLNFDPSEILDKERLVAIAADYMERIGFGFQPYLIYEHLDAGHPHMHILTTNIESDGHRIDMHNIAISKSQPARIAIEIDHNLVKAEQQEKTIDQENTKLTPVIYGKTDSKRAITNIVGIVTKSYKFTSLPEFNAILNTYNILADQGRPNSVMFKNNGLRYWIIDETGKKMGVPIKASSLYKKPTMKMLTGRFRLNETLRKPFKEELKSQLDRTLLGSKSMDELQAALKKQGVQLVKRHGKDMRLYGLTFIDHHNKTVFNGSDLGKAYSVGGILRKLDENIINGNSTAPGQYNRLTDHMGHVTPSHFAGKSTTDMLNELLGVYDHQSPVPYQLEQNKRKKKRKKLNL